ncbi:helix-turn-helix domain-containing protein [Hominifimenecus sp. rT4P-3]|uniref:helix-turn-helix transcriptional regulator n=1 Tax=Hominifimenecus sp. rT4P-3 TaxID=3242979 RepID=UPI003DA34E00
MRQRMEAFRRLIHTQKLYFQIFGSLCLLSIVMLAFFLFYANTAISGEKNTSLHRIRALGLQDKSESLERMMDYLAASMEQTLWTDDFVMALINPDAVNDEVSQRIVKNLASQQAANSMLEKIFFISDRSGILYHSDHYYMPWEYSTEVSVYERHLERAHPEKHPSNQKGNWQVMTWNQKIYLVIDMKTPYYVGSCLLELNQRELEDILKSNLENIEICVYDEDKSPILGTEVDYGELPDEIQNIIYVEQLEQADLTSGATTAYYLQGEHLRWSYFMIPQKQNPTGWFSQLVVLLPVAILSAAFCVFLSWLISKRVYAPIRVLLKNAIEKRSDLELYSETEVFSNQLKETNESRERMNLFLQVMSRDILEQVIRKYVLGKYGDENYIEEALKEIGAESLLHGRYVVICGGYRYLNPERPQIFENTLHNHNLINLVWQMHYENLTLCPVAFSNTNFMIVCCFSEEAASPYIRKIVVTIMEQIKQLVQDQPFEAILSASPISMDIRELRNLWLETREKVLFQQYLDGEVSETGEAEHQMIRKYVQENTKQMLAFALEGDAAAATDKADCIVAQMKHADEKERQAWKQILFEAITDALLELHVPVENIQRLQVENGLTVGQIPEDTDEFARCYRGFCTDMAHMVVTENRKRRYRYVDVAKAYIQEHFNDCDLSLSEISNVAGISASYLSTLFVEVTETTFISYLNQYRVDMAKQMLSASALSASEIGFRCGFHSNQTFYRVFKKFTGMAPNQYREIQKGTNVTTL